MEERKSSFTSFFPSFTSPEGVRLSNRLLEKGLRVTMMRSTEIRETLVPEFKKYVEERKRLKCWVDNIQGPLFAAIDVTYRCNLRCPYCYLSAGERHSAPTLSFKDFTHIIDILVNESRILGLCICGGEPTLHPRLQEMIAYAKEHDLIVNMVTNGTILNDQLAKKLSKLEIDSVQVSLDGSTPEVMDRLRGRGTFKRAVNAIQALVSNNIITMAAMTLTKFNIHDFPNVAELSEKLRLYSLRTMFYIPEHTRHMPLVPSDEEYKQVIQWIQNNQRNYRCIFEFGDPTEHITLGPYIGHLMISINPEGFILPSPYISLAYGNILREPWQELWPELEKLWFENPVFNAISRYLRNERDFMILGRIGLNRQEKENIVNVRDLKQNEAYHLANLIREVLHA